MAAILLTFDQSCKSDSCLLLHLVSLSDFLDIVHIAKNKTTMLNRFLCRERTENQVMKSSYYSRTYMKYT